MVGVEIITEKRFEFMEKYGKAVLLEVNLPDDGVFLFALKRYLFCFF